METRFDCLVIGAGQGGGPLSSALARAGKRTVVVERAHVGGTCVNEGCTPTKTMIASAKVAYLARRGPEYGVVNDVHTVDMTTVRDRKRAMVESWRRGSEQSLTSTPNLELLMGEAAFVGEKTVRVALHSGLEQTIHADLIVVNTGMRPAIPAIPGLDGVPHLDSTSIMELAHVPDHLIVIGGGYIGLEFGQMFRRFGSQVTIIQRGAKLLSREDNDIADAIADILREDGITVMLNAEPIHVEGRGNSAIEVTVRTAEGETALRGSHLLLATGRVPNTDRLNAASAGLALDKRGFIKVDERLQTNVPGIFAIGDVKGGPAFTHISYDDFRVLRTNLVDGGETTTAGRLVPYTVFIDPQLGRVGLGEDEARAAGRKVRVAKMPMSSVARALETGEPRGMMKAIIDAETDQILGFAVLGLEGGELMASVQIAMMGKLAYTALRDAVFAHPTIAESLNNLFATNF